MKNLVSLTLLLSIASICCIQKAIDLSLNDKYFLLGTLNDYMGREKYPEIENRVDKYYQSERALCLSIDSMFKESYPDLKLSSDKHETTGRDEFELHSELLAREIEKFYYCKPSGRGAYKGKVDMRELNLDSLSKTKYFLTTYFDTIYTGRVRSSDFETERQKLSFITGAYVRFGSRNDSTYYISVANSISKIRVLDGLLKEVGCTNVEYKMKKYVPVGHAVYFIPTDTLRSYFKKYMRLR